MTISDTMARNEAGVSRDAVLDVADLEVRFDTPDGTVYAVNGISFKLAEGETLAILGESGCGKSVAMQAVMGLVRRPPGRIGARHIRFRSTDLLDAPPAVMRKHRGQRIAMIFQDPFMSLDLTTTVGQQIGEMFRVHLRASRNEARRQAIELMERVRIPSARSRVDDYPHQFSGGMSQRIMIASAIALEPDVLIADEPTTALDVTVQAQIMEILRSLRDEIGMAVILITHDLGLAAENADRAAVMYAGRFVETGQMEDIYHRPAHPYTIGLLRSVPNIGYRGGKLEPIAGAPPVLSHQPVGCPFRPRCPWRRERCEHETPLLREVLPGRAVACHFAEELCFRGKDIFSLPRSAFRQMRRDIQIIFQNPYASLNPRLRVAQIIGEPFEIFPNLVPRKARRARVRDLLDRVGLNPDFADRHPHEFSGGQRQRIGIARALALEPSVIICDEPVSALDVSVQAQVINLLEDIQAETGVGLYLYCS